MNSVLKALQMLTELKTGWGKGLKKRWRFLFAGFFGLIAYLTFKHFGKLETKEITWAFDNLSDPTVAFMVVYTSLVIAFTFYVSILATAAATSLIPKSD